MFALFGSKAYGRLWAKSTFAYGLNQAQWNTKRTGYSLNRRDFAHASLISIRVSHVDTVERPSKVVIAANARKYALCTTSSDSARF